MLSWTWNDYRAKRSWYSAQFLFKNGHIKSAEKQYSELVRAIDYNKDPLLDYGKVLYKIGYVGKATEVLSFASKFIGDPFLFCNLGDAYVALKKPSEAENAYKMAININPNRLYPRYLLTLLYHRNNRIHEADSLARYIIKMPIKVESSATNEMIFEMKKLRSK
jgi:tetratricopeptide (TPR) repeat protein